MILSDTSKSCSPIWIRLMSKDNAFNCSKFWQQRRKRFLSLISWSKLFFCYLLTYKTFGPICRRFRQKHLETKSKPYISILDSNVAFVSKRKMPIKKLIFCISSTFLFEIHSFLEVLDQFIYFFILETKIFKENIAL